MLDSIPPISKIRVVWITQDIGIDLGKMLANDLLIDSNFNKFVNPGLNKYMYKKLKIHSSEKRYIDLEKMYDDIAEDLFSSQLSYDQLVIKMEMLFEIKIGNRLINVENKSGHDIKKNLYDFNSNYIFRILDLDPSAINIIIGGTNIFEYQCIKSIPNSVVFHIHLYCLDTCGSNILHPFADYTIVANPNQDDTTYDSNHVSVQF